jgi:S1-C subfamily serine protease
VAETSDVSSIRPGSLALVVGRTRASGPVAALGAVSLVVAERRAWTGAALAPYIRLDIGVQPTAVGGAVIDPHGRVIGIATPRFARFGAIGIPAPAVNRVVETLLQKGRIPRGYLGVGLQPVRLPDALRRTLKRGDKTAAIVLEVEPEGPADKAGIVIGDIFVALAGHTVTRLEDVHGELGAESIGKSLSLKFVRGGALQEASLVVGERGRGAE